jgi:4-hydroxybenzoate polyprenyltransferase
MEDIYTYESKERKQAWHSLNFDNLNQELTGVLQGIRPSLYHLKTAFLITKSDMKTTVFPATTFALASVISGPLLTTDTTPSIYTILLRLPQAILWIWMNLWIFNLANQRLPNSVVEDSINKPWRAIPSGRLTPKQARQLLLISIPIVYLSTLYLGGRDESILLMVLTWIYNDLGAGDENFLFRHFNNALGFATFGAGATQVICGFPNHTLNTTAYQWLAVIAAVITCTIQFQDMEDQEGDRIRDRKTLPIILGDSNTRYLNAVVIMIFSLIAPAFWQLSLDGYLIPATLGIVISTRSLTLKTVAADKTTFKLWCLWLITLYLLPLVKQPGALAGLRPALS